jgi:hypothetical protein
MYHANRDRLIEPFTSLSVAQDHFTKSGIRITRVFRYFIRPRLESIEAASPTSTSILSEPGFQTHCYSL